MNLLRPVLLAGAMVFSARAPGQTPPTPAMPPSPIQQFRTWLTLTEGERQVVLASRSPRSRQMLEAKLKEYSALPDLERERRLKVMEVHWYLRPLLELPSTNRPQAVARVPEKFRSIVEDRLRRWDQLAGSVRDQMLTNETALAFLIQPPQMSPPPPPMPREFDRREMERTLASYAKLSPTQRQKCIESFARLSRLPPAERTAFLRNAERWQEMTPQERNAWRQIVSIRPPTPPGADVPVPPIPN